MTLTRALLFIVFLASMPSAATASFRKSRYAKRQLTLIEAYTQESAPGRMGGEAAKSHHIVVVWHYKTSPDSFFWSGNGDWTPCKVEKVHPNPIAQKKLPGQADYIIERIPRQQIRAGDTLMLTSLSLAKTALPIEISGNPRNTLYFKTGKSKWISFPVKVISKKRSKAMP